MYKATMLKKELIAASTEPLLLSILARGENYGYALIQQVKAASGGEICWTDGMLYPVLHRLERQGQIKSRWKTSDAGRKRKYYSIQTKGRVALRQTQSQWQIVTDTLNLLKGPGYVRS